MVECIIDSNILKKQLEREKHQCFNQRELMGGVN